MLGNLICMICGFNRFKSAGNNNCLEQPPALHEIISIQMLIGYKLVLVVNFNTDNIADNIFRKAYGLY